MATTIDYQVSSFTSNGFWCTSEAYFNNSYYLYFGLIDGGRYNTFVRFTGVTIPAGSTITAAKLSLYYYAADSPTACTIYAEDAAAPTAPTTPSDADGRTKTTENISITSPITGTWFDSSDIKAIIQELVNSYSYASGAAMQFFILSPTGSGTHFAAIEYYESDPTRAAKLHIEYTSGGAITITDSMLMGFDRGIDNGINRGMR
jgi:hypothetical protein